MPTGAFRGRYPVTTSPAIEETPEATLLGPPPPCTSESDKKVSNIRREKGDSCVGFDNTTNALEDSGIRQAMSRSRRFLRSIAPFVFVLSFLGGNARAQELTPGQGATDRLFYLVLVPAVAIGILVMALVAYAVIKFRVRKGHTVGPVNAKTHDRKLETLWTIIPAIILVVVGIAGFQTLIVTDTIPQNPDAVTVVTARLWAWNFTTTFLPAGTVVPSTGGFTVKVGQTVKLVFRSIDVAHAFWIPAFDLKLDVIPGHLNVYWFKALKAGDYEIHCAEFCGLGHYSMVATLHVTPS